MSPATLAATAKAVVGGGRGLLTIEESTSTCNKRFAASGIAQTEEARRAYRENCSSRRRALASMSAAPSYMTKPSARVTGTACGSSTALSQPT